MASVNAGFSTMWVARLVTHLLKCKEARQKHDYFRGKHDYDWHTMPKLVFTADAQNSVSRVAQPDALYMLLLLPLSTSVHRIGCCSCKLLELLLFLGDSRHGHCDMQAQLNGKAAHMCSCSSKGSSGLLVLWHAGLEGWLSPAKGKLLVITKQSVNWEDKQVADLSGIIRHLVVGKTVCHVRCHMRNWMPTGLALPSSWCFARKRLLRLGLTLLSLALPI